MSVSYKIGESAGYKTALTINQEKRIKNIYGQALKTVQKQLKDAQKPGSNKKSYQITYLKNLEVQLQESYKNISKQVLSEIKNNVLDISKFVVGESNDLMNNLGINVQGAFSYIPKDVVNTITNGTIYTPKMKLSQRIWGCESATMKDIRYITAQGVALNKSTYEIAKDLEKYVDPAAKKDWAWSKVYPGTSKRVDYNAQRVARTTITHAYQQTVKEYTEQNPFSDGIEWLASGTERMCEICAARDGKIYKPEDLPLDHPNGMCTMAIHFPKSLEDIAQERQEALGDEAAKLQDKINQFKQNAAAPQNISTGDIQKSAEKKIAEKKVKVPQFTNWQKTYLEPYGYTPEKIPSYDEWLSNTSIPDSVMEKFYKSAQKEGKTLNEFFDAKLGKVKYKYKSVSELTNTVVQKTMPEAAEKAKAIEKTVKTEKKVKVAEFTANQNKYLSPYGYTVDNMPGDFWEWYAKADPAICSKLEQEAIKAGMSDVEYFNATLGKLKYKYKSLAEVEKVATTASEPVVDYVAQMNLAKQEMDDIGSKIISGVWKDDVTVSEYASKIDSISKKKQYYMDEISKLTTSADDMLKYDKFHNLLNQLDDFEAEGKKYMAAKAKYLDAKKALNPTGNVVGKFSEDMYTNEAKKAAKNFAKRTEADKYYREILDRQWGDLTEREKYSVWEYTRGSGAYNRPLSGYDYSPSWSRRDFKGVGNVSLQNERMDKYTYGDFGKFMKSDGYADMAQNVADLTKAIEKTAMEDSCMLIRKSTDSGLAGIIEGDLFSYDDAMRIIQSRNVEEMKNAFVGQTFTNHAFTSTGMAKDYHWSGNIQYNIFCPEGTKAIYCEPQSYYGNTISGEQLYHVGDSYHSVGAEAEVLLQRGTQYRITDIRYKHKNIEIDMEVVGQPDYFKTGLEHTHTGGVTSFTK